MRLRTKMLLLPAVAVATFVTVEGVSLTVAARGDQLIAEIERTRVPELMVVHDLRSRLAEVQQALRDAVAARDVRAVRATAALREAFARSAREAEALVEPGGEGARSLSSAFDAYYQVAAASAADLAAGRASSEDVEVLVAYDQIEQVVHAAEDHARDHLREALAGAAGAQRAGRRAVSLAIGLGALLTAALAGWIFSGVVTPLLQLGRAASRIATDGDLSQQVDVAGDDELGRLAGAFRAMVARLRGVPRAVEASVSSVSGAVRAVGGATTAQARALEQEAATLAVARRVATRVRSAGAEASGRAQQVLAVAAEAEAFGARGQREARSSLQALAALRDEVRAAVRRIARMDEHVDRAGLQLDALRQAASTASEASSALAVELARGGSAAGGEEHAALVARLRAALAGVLQASARVRAILDDARRLAAGMIQADRDEGRLDEAFAQLEASGTIQRELLQRLQRTGKAAREIVDTVARQESGLAEVTEAITGVDGYMGEVLAHVSQTRAATQALEQEVGRLSALVASFRL